MVEIIEFSVVVSLDGYTIDEISQAIYNILKDKHEIAFVDVIDEYEDS